MSAFTQIADATTGVLHVHSSPSARCPHVDWAIAATLGCRARVRWSSQPAARGELRATINWVGPVGTGARLATALSVWPELRFEVTEDVSEGVDGERFCFTPERGLWRGTMSANGDTVISELRLRALMASRPNDLQAALNEELGTDWDAELEPFRFAGEGAEVTWISRRVG
ncbi:DUF3145 domain-containing protein [Hoyosella rhizosphaerae]|uniref:DUF3145 domain-containing protein n=1 Tax=Hoyosella rhizosphaerae TaxID=1755582 RepID=A0A916UGD1_9ACTN|nr:DUF3145 domain-containing protein [Hoyosella rhizosphaerae]MBN4928015.1 DUF3145 domain-containing protein [Hoyosella rhizosphaerae]GGC71726.1 hypothetical protein GCM10011410_25910 [Hoyosella rhizosphaerae]